MRKLLPFALVLGAACGGAARTSPTTPQAGGGGAGGAPGQANGTGRAGHSAAGVPGSVAGLYEAWKTAGHLPWRDVVAPAIRLAQGHVLDHARSRSIAEDADRLRLFPASKAQFLVGDSAPPPGTMFRQPALAHTLQLIADSGPDVFYKGQIAVQIVAEMQRGHGLITR